MTAGHCLPRALEDKHINVLLGHPPLHKERIYAQNRVAKDVLVHQNYSLDKNGIQSFYDIGLIHLDHPAKVTDYVKPIGIGTVNYNHSVDAYGYGSTNAIYDDMSYFLRMRTLEIIDDNKCEMLLKEATYETKKSWDEVCLTEGVCWGDSGSPIIQKVEGKQKIVGILSWGVDDIVDCLKPPMMAVKVSEYIEWINEGIEKLRNKS